MLPYWCRNSSAAGPNRPLNVTGRAIGRQKSCSFLVTSMKDFERKNLHASQTALIRWLQKQERIGKSWILFWRNYFVNFRKSCRVSFHKFGTHPYKYRLDSIWYTPFLEAFPQLTHCNILSIRTITLSAETEQICSMKWLYPKEGEEDTVCFWSCFVYTFTVRRRP